MKKRTCDRCKAQALSFNMRDTVCALFYEIEVDENGMNAKPAVECPKPLTHKAFRDEIRKRKTS